MPALEATRTPHHTMIHCQGNLTIYEASAFHAELSPLLEPGATLPLEEITLLASLNTSASAGDPSAAPHAAP